MKIFFVDDRPYEIRRLWSNASLSGHTLLPPTPFESIDTTLAQVRQLGPDVIAVGYGLGWNKPKGPEVIAALRATGYQGVILANSGGGVRPFLDAGVVIDASIDRQPEHLKAVLMSLGGETDGL